MSTNQYVTVAQALASGSDGLLVQDSVANIAAALPNPKLLPPYVTSVTLAGTGTVGVAQLAQLEKLPALYTGGFQITVSDAAYNLLNPTAGLFTKAFPSASGGAEKALVAHTTLTGNPSLSAAQLTQLESLPGFTVAQSDHVTISDSLTNIASAVGNHPGWFAPVTTVTVRLDGAHIGAFAAAQLGVLAAGGKTVTFTPSGVNTTLNVTAAAASIAASAAGLADLAGHVTVVYTVAAPVVPVTAADGVALAGLAGFNVSAQALPVADTGANLSAHAAALFGHGFSSISVSSGNFAGTAGQLADATLHEAAGATVSLAASATVNVAAADALVALQGFSLGAGATLTVQDSAANLVALAPAALAIAVTVELAASQSVTVAQLEALAAYGGKFSAGNYTLGVSGTAAALEAVPAAALHLAGQVTVLDSAANIATAAGFAWGNAHVTYELSQPGSVTAAQAATLAGLGVAFSLNNQALSVADTATNTVAAAATLAALGIHANVTDTLADVAANESGLALLGASLATITLSAAATSSAGAVAGLAPIAGKLVAGSQLTVADSAANVSANLAGLVSVAAALHNTLALDVSGSAAQLATDVASFAATGATLDLTVTGSTTVTASQAVALAPYVAGLSLSISDTGADVAQYAAQLSPLAHEIAGLTLTDIGTPYTASVAAALASSGLDSKLAGGVKISVTDGAANIGTAVVGLQQLASDGRLAGVSDSTDNAAAVAANVAALNSVQARVTLQDITANVQAHIDALGQVQNLERITLTDAGLGQIPNLAFNVQQLTSDASVATAVLAATAGAKFNVLDTATAIAADLTSANSVIIADHAELHSVTSTNGPINLTLLQEQTLAGDIFNPLAGFSAPIPFDLTNVSLANLAAAQALTPVNITIADSSANLTANLAGNNAITSGNTLTGIDGITVTDNGPVTVNVSQLGRLALLFTQTPSLIVSDTASDISAGLVPHAALINELIADPASISTINISSGTTTVQLTAEEAQQLAGANLLATFAGLLPHGASLSIATDLADLASVIAIPAGQLAHITVNVADTAANLAADLLSANSQLQHDSSIIGSVTLVADTTIPLPTLTAAGMNALYNYGFVQPQHAVPLPVADTVAGILSVSATALEQASSVAVTDSSADLAAALGVAQTATALEALATHFGNELSITLNDAAPAVNVSYATVSGDTAVLQAITNASLMTGRGPVIVTDVAANLAPAYQTLLGDTFIGKVVVADTAADIAAQNLAHLQGLGSLLWVQLTDAQLNAAELTATNNGVTLLQSAHLSTTGGGVFDTAQNIAGLVTAGGAAALTFLNSYGATVTSTVPAYVTVPQLEALERLTDLHTGGQSFAVFDTAVALTGAGAAAALGSNLVSGVYLNATNNAATLTAAATTALFSLPNFHNTDLNGTANVLTVDDTAAGIDAVHTQLASLSASLGNSLAGIQVDETAQQGHTESISAATLADLRSLNATLASGTLYVVDTPANIATAVAQAPVTPTISPTGWQLSTSGAVTVAQAEALGSLAGQLSTNNGHQFAVSVALAADTTVTVLQADELGNLGAALVLTLNGHHLYLNDTAANLLTLSNAAQSAVLPNASVVVTDTAPISEATADAFLLALGSHMFTAAQLSFAHTETVIDTLANLSALTTEVQSLTGVANTGWTGNTTLENAFQFTAADSVANLILSNNTAALAALHGCTVAPDAQSTVATTDAASAETLATMASQIHFSIGTTPLVVTDTAANLLSALNQAGVALASTVTLSSADVSAAQAAGLLAMHNFAATQASPMVIQDTAANLLNGPLDTALANSASAPNITVALQPSQPVTVQQAAELASLPHFEAGNNLLIADSTANLLSHANSAVVADAYAVTLAGNETVSAATILALSQLANFQIASPGAVLTLAASTAVDQPTLLAIANLGADFNVGASSLTLAANTGTVTLSAAQFSALLNDGAVLSGVGNTIAIADSAANLSALFASGAWAGLSGAIQHSYDLVSNDTVAHLLAIGTPASYYALGLSDSESLTAAQAESLAAAAAATTSGHLAYNGHGLTVAIQNSDVANNAAGVALATALQVTAANATTLLANNSFTLHGSQTLTVQATLANLQAGGGALYTAIEGNANRAGIGVQLTAPATASATDLANLAALPSFNDGGNALTLSGSGNITNAATLDLIANLSQPLVAGNNTLTLTQSVTGLSVAQITALGADHVVLANSVTLGITDTVNDIDTLLGQSGGLLVGATYTASGAGSVTASQLAALADLGGQFSDGGYAVTLTQDALALTPAEYGALQTDGVLANQYANGHVISAALGSQLHGGATATDTSGVLTFTASASVPNATVKVYDSSGNLLTSVREGHSGFQITAADPADAHGNGHAFSFTEVVNGVESAPVVVLDQGALESAVLAAGATFAANAAISLNHNNETLAIYTAGVDVPHNLTNPALVYDPGAHTVSLDIPGSAPLVLVTLGAATDPATAASLDVIVKAHH